MRDKGKAKESGDVGTKEMSVEEEAFVNRCLKGLRLEEGLRDPHTLSLVDI